MEQERLCEIDATNITNKFATVKSTMENTFLSSRFVAFDNRLRHLYCRLPCLNIAMIKFVDESGIIDYCPGTVLRAVQQCIS